MKACTSYIIIHTNFKNQIGLPAQPNSQTGNYIVYWWNDIALGQVFIEPGNTLSEKEYQAKIINAIKPALNFYARKLPGKKENWQSLLERHDYVGWQNWMKAVFSNWLWDESIKKVPVSVVVCTHNRSAFIGQCINQLTSQFCLPEEIIIVDNAPPDDSTKDIVEKFTGVTYVREPRAGLDIARNTGALSAKFPIVAYVDDDVQVHPLWTYRIWETFNDPAVSGVTGLVIASKLETEAQVIFETRFSFNRGYFDKIFDHNFFKANLRFPNWKIGPGANMSFRKEALLKVGLFDELLEVGPKAAGCDGDSEMYFKLMNNGYAMYYNPRAIVHHEHRKDIKGLKKQIYNYFRGYSAAALSMQKQNKEAGYYKILFKNFPRKYMRHIIKGFPKYEFTYKTLGVEIKGFLSGLLFYARNHRQLGNSYYKSDK